MNMQFYAMNMHKLCHCIDLNMQNMQIYCRIYAEYMH